MQPVFHYAHSRRRTALNLLLGMLVLPLWLWLLSRLGAGRAGIDDFMALATKVTVGVEVGLACLCVWLLTHPDRFEITVTADRFEVHHPTFAQWSFCVAPSDLVRIEHTLDVHGFSAILLHLRAGQPLRLCKNYGYSRARLYAALQSVNPGLCLPERSDGFYRRSKT